MTKFLLYGLNGVINTAVTLAIYALLTRVIDYRLAVLISYPIGICLSYFLNGAIVFRTYGRFRRFVVVSLFLMLLNLALTALCVEVLGWNPVIAQVPAIAVVYVVGFLLNKLLVFVPPR